MPHYLVKINEPLGPEIRTPDGAEVEVTAGGTLVVRRNAGIWHAWSPGTWKRVSRVPEEAFPAGKKYSVILPSPEKPFHSVPLYDMRVVNGSVVLMLGASNVAYLFAPGLWKEAGPSSWLTSDEQESDLAV